MHFYNIPESPKESNEECVQKMKQVLSKLGVLPNLKLHASIEQESPVLAQRLHHHKSISQDQYWHDCFVSHMMQSGSTEKSCSKVLVFSKVMIDKDLSLESARDKTKLRAV